jgi:CHAD domain-containing protein
VKLQTDAVAKPLQKLRAQLNNFPSSPPPEDVHSLRTHARRLEAIVAALELNREKKTRHLLKLIAPVRKAAGKVRDMDVLIGDALTLSENRGGESMVRLVEHLAELRVRHARKLREVIGGRRRDIRKCLKQSSKLMSKKLKDSSAAIDGETGPRTLITELSLWPDLHEGNLHLFRIRIKELRYMLQLSEEADATVVDSLGEVKDTIGDWHDWVELQKIAGKVLDPQDDREVLTDIERTGNEKLQVALTAAKRVRHLCSGVPDSPKASAKILQMAS